MITFMTLHYFKATHVRAASLFLMAAAIPANSLVSFFMGSTYGCSTVTEVKQSNRRRTVLVITVH